jgi:hypothetical protein
MVYITNPVEPSWVKILKNKHKNDKLYKYISITFFFIFLLLLLLAFPLVFLPSPDSVYADIIAFTIFIGLFTSTWFLLKNHFNYLNLDCLAYFLYKTGNNLINFRESDLDNYFKTNQALIKKSMEIIKYYKNYKHGVFSDNISQFFLNLEKLCLRLNFLYSKDCNHTTYAEQKLKLSHDIIKLADLIKEKQSYLSSTHTETIDNILNSPVDVPEKQFKPDNIHINISLPYYLKICVLLVAVFITVLFGTIKFVNYFFNTELITYNTIMLFTGTIIAGLMYFIKK